MINRLKRDNVLYYIVFGVFAVFYVIRNINYIDIVISDEVVYLNSALHFSFPVTNNYNGTIYTLWYYVINKITHDPINTYYVNYFFASIVSVGVIFYLLLHLKYNKFYSLLISLLLLYSQFNTLLLPKITQIASVFLVLGIMLILKAKTQSEKLFITGFTALIIAYIRPEYYVAFILTIILLVFFAIYYLSKGKKAPLKELGLIILGGIFLYILFNGTPLTNRSFDAFVQHYVRNYCEVHHINHPKSIGDEFKLFKEVYNSESHSLVGALFDEPAKFFNHVLVNLKNTFVYLLKIFNSIFFEGVIVFLPSYAGYIKIVVALFLVIVIDWRKTIKMLPLGVIKENILPILILFMPCIIGVLIVYPREHYLVLLLILVFIALLGIFTKAQFRLINKTEIVIPSLLILMLGLMMFTSYKSNTHYTAMYKLGRDISKKEELSFIDDYFAKVYYGEKAIYKLNSTINTEQNFVDFLNINKVKFFHISNSQGLVGITKQKGFNTFVKNFAKFGFVKINLTKFEDDYLLIDKDLYKAFEAKKYFN